MRTGNLKSEKLMILRLEIGMCKVCRVKAIFSHTIYYQIFEQKNVRNGYMYPAHPAQAPWEKISRCGKRCFLPCTRYTGEAEAEPDGTRGDAATPHKMTRQCIHCLVTVVIRIG